MRYPIKCLNHFLTRKSNTIQAPSNPRPSLPSGSFGANSFSPRLGAGVDGMLQSYSTLSSALHRTSSRSIWSPSCE